MHFFIYQWVSSFIKISHLNCSDIHLWYHIMKPSELASLRYYFWFFQILFKKYPHARIKRTGRGDTGWVLCKVNSNTRLWFTMGLISYCIHPYYYPTPITAFSHWKQPWRGSPYYFSILCSKYSTKSENMILNSKLHEFNEIIFNTYFAQVSMLVSWISII